MEFELTHEISDEIIFAMEDQTGHFLYDSAECRCVASRELSSGAKKAEFDDEDRYYAIPVWDSVSGFRMMERFVAQLRNPVVREELRAALSSGHGVFRNFKNILKEHAEIERLWYLFKEREMKNIVLEWYNSLRDFWGLERIGAEPEETDELVSHDFQFRAYAAEDENQLEILLSSIDREIAEGIPAELFDALVELTERMRNDDVDAECVILTESAEGEIVGAAISAPLPAESFLCAQLSVIAVFPEFRGLGIGKELLSRTIEYWEGKGYRWLLFTSPIGPQVFFPVLHRSGFIEKGHVSVLDLSGAHCH